MSTSYLKLEALLLNTVPPPSSLFVSSADADNFWKQIGSQIRTNKYVGPSGSLFSTYTSPNENFEHGYPNSNALLQFPLKLEPCKLHSAAHHPTKCDVINDVKLFPAVYRRIYCRKILTWSNQMPCYKIKCIRILVVCSTLWSAQKSVLKWCWNCWNIPGHTIYRGKTK